MVKLLQCGVSGEIFDLIKNMYQSAKTVCVHSAKSHLFDCTIGVRQDECLSLLLSAMYIDVLENLMSENGQTDVKIDHDSIVMLAYADDVVLLNESAEGL